MKSRPILLPYQTRWLEDDSRFKIGMFSRQSGKTFVATLEIVLDMIRAEMEISGCPVWQHCMETVLQIFL